MKTQLPFLFLGLLALSCEEPPATEQTMAGPSFERPVPSPEVPPLSPVSLQAALPPVTSSLPGGLTDSFPDSSRKFRKALPPEKLAAREDLVSFARQYMGVPYIYAMSDPEKGFDCSGYIYYVYNHYQIPVPRSSIEYKTYGREIPLSQARPADLILFTGAQDTDRIGHIGIILKATGDATQFVHASSGKEMAVTISSLASPHYRKRFVKVVDVISK